MSVWDDDDRPWHCGTCGNAPCECGTDLVLVLKVPGVGPSTTDADLVAMSVLSMLNEVRADNGGDAAPIRCVHAEWLAAEDRGQTDG